MDLGGSEGWRVAAQEHSLEVKSQGGGWSRSLQTSDRRAKVVREFVYGETRRDHKLFGPDTPYYR